MIIRCPNCEHSRSIPDGKIPAGAEFATCPKCAHRFRFRTREPLRDARPLLANTTPPSPGRAPAPKPDPRHTDIWDAMENLNIRLEAQPDAHIIKIEELPPDEKTEKTASDFTDAAQLLSEDPMVPVPEERLQPDLNSPAGKVLRKLTSLFQSKKRDDDPQKNEIRETQAVPEISSSSFEEQSPASEANEDILPWQPHMDIPLTETKQDTAQPDAPVHGMVHAPMDPVQPPESAEENEFTSLPPSINAHPDDAHEVQVHLAPDQYSLFEQMGEVSPAPRTKAFPQEQRVVPLLENKNSHPVLHTPKTDQAVQTPALEPDTNLSRPERQDSSLPDIVWKEKIQDRGLAAEKNESVGLEMADQAHAAKPELFENKPEQTLEPQVKAAFAHPLPESAGKAILPLEFPLSSTASPLPPAEETTASPVFSPVDTLQLNEDSDLKTRRENSVTDTGDQEYPQTKEGTGPEHAPLPPLPDVEESAALDAVFALHGSGCAYSFEDKTVTPEQKADNDIQLLLMETDRPSRDLGRIDEHWQEAQASVPTASVSMIPWENTRQHGWFLGFIRTVYGVLFNAPLFFSHLGSSGSLAPAYLFFLLQCYISILCTSAWKQAFETFMETARGTPPGQTLLPILLITAPVVFGFLLLLLTGTIKILLRLFAPEKADFPLLFKVISYASAPLLLSIIPFAGPLAGIIWCLFAFITGCKTALGMSWRLVLCMALPCLLLFLGTCLLLFI